MQTDVPLDWFSCFGAERWPTLRIEFEPSPLPFDGELYQRIEDGFVCVDPATGRARVPRVAGRSLDDLVHPHLTVAAHLSALSRGDDPLHAGSCAHAGGAWVFLGDHEQGKSTLLALLQRLGCQPLADDLTVIRGDQICAGPRCVDLRPSAARHLGIGRPARVDTRWRVSLPPVPAEHRLRGFLHLRWATHIQLRQLSARERLTRLVAHIGHLPHAPERLLEFAELPHYELSRPRDWKSAADSALVVRDMMTEGGPRP
jgi:hypothetical protein